MWSSTQTSFSDTVVLAVPGRSVPAMLSSEVPQRISSDISLGRAESSRIQHPVERAARHPMIGEPGEALERPARVSFPFRGGEFFFVDERQ